MRRTVERNGAGNLNSSDPFPPGKNKSFFCRCFDDDEKEIKRRWRGKEIKIRKGGERERSEQGVGGRRL
jgi:hypothetical protein